MSDLREAAQQALEALEWHLDWGTWGADLDGCAAALRAALEQKAEPVPAGYLVSPHGEFKPNFNLRFTFPPESLDWSIPLYTAPPQRKPLTDDEILEMVRAAPDLGAAEDEWLHVARAIERAHGIGEEE